MSEVDKELDELENEELDLKDQEQEVTDDSAEQLEDKQEEEQELEEEDSEEDALQDEDEEPKKPISRREQLRIHTLLQKIKEDDSPSSAKATDAAKGALNYEDELDADADTITKLKTDRDGYGEKQYRQGIEDAYRFSKFETRLEVDAPRVAAKYTQLDKDSDDFNPVLADTINRMYLSFVGFDGSSRRVNTADVRYADYVESVYELADEIAGHKVEAVTTNLKKQASKTSIRPGGSSPKRMNLNKAPQDMTEEELNAAIRASMPR